VNASAAGFLFQDYGVGYVDLVHSQVFVVLRRNRGAWGGGGGGGGGDGDGGSGGGCGGGMHAWMDMNASMNRGKHGCMDAYIYF
jgi:hypothetical protein